MAEIDWVIVEKFNKKIGAVGFLGDQACVVVSFYNDADGNRDGKVSWGERIASKISPISVKGSAVVEVAMWARGDSDIVLRDPTFSGMAVNMWQNFALNSIAQGIYAVYFSRAVGEIAGHIAGRVTTNLVAGYAIRKGMEGAVKSAYLSATQH